MILLLTHKLLTRKLVTYESVTYVVIINVVYIMIKACQKEILSNRPLLYVPFSGTASYSC